MTNLYKITFLLLTVFYLLLNTSCGIYSFTGASIHPDVKTVKIITFANLANNVAPSLTATLTNKLKDKCTSEARLSLNNTKGDVQFSGQISSYTIEPVASGANDIAALNKLTISIKVDYTNNITNENWTKVFSQFANFDKNVLLSNAIELQLIDEISEKLVNDIFNGAFANW